MLSNHNAAPQRYGRSSLLGGKRVAGRSLRSSSCQFCGAPFYCDIFLLHVSEVAGHARTKVWKGTTCENEGYGKGFPFEVGETDGVAEFVGQMEIWNVFARVQNGSIARTTRMLERDGNCSGD